VQEDIGISIAKEKEEVHVEDVQMDKDYDIDHSNTEETLQRSLAKDPFLVCMEVLATSGMSMLVKKCSSQEVSKMFSRQKDQDIKLKSKDIKIKIKIQDHKHAKGTSKEFPRIQGSKIQDVTRSESLSAMTTP
ncbi:hypothetical protein Tco_1288400, partial [Tanacetum coccineum]